MAAVAALTLGPAVLGGFKKEIDVMSKDHTKGAWNRIGHGFKAFGSGFIDSLETGGVKEGTSIALVHHGELIIPEEHVNEVITQSKKAKVLSKRKAKRVSKADALKEVEVE